MKKLFFLVSLAGVAAVMLCLRIHYSVFDPVTAEPRSLLYDGFESVATAGEGRTCKLSRASNGFFFDSLGQPDGAQKGDRIALYNRGGASGVEIRGDNRVSLERVTVFSSPSFGIWEGMGTGGNTYRGCRIVRKPGTTRLLSTVADGLHSYRVRKGPVIEGCEISDTVDDSIAIHGFFNLVLEAPSARTVYLVSPFGQDFSAGAGLSFYEMPHGRPLGEAVVRSVEKIPASALSKPVGEVRESFIKQQLLLRDLPVTQALKVDLDRDVALPPGSPVLASSGEQCGSGAVVRNNTLRRGHMMGILVKADDVLVQPELFFLEGSIPRRVTIRGNAIAHCGWQALNRRFAFHHAGAIQTNTSMARRQFPPQFDPYPLIRDVTISDNTIKDSGGYAIVVGNVMTGRIADNRIEYPFGKPGAVESKGLDQAFDSKEHPLEKPASSRATPAGILIFGSNDIAVSGNTVFPTAEKGGVPPLIVGPWCQGVETSESKWHLEKS